MMVLEDTWLFPAVAVLKVGGACTIVVAIVSESSAAEVAMTGFDLIFGYTDLGWQVMPCQVASKAGRFSHERASSHPERVDHWLKCYGGPETGGANWAVVCGPGSGILVVDVENAQGFGQLRERGELPPCPTVDTGGSKQGAHFYVKHPARPIRNWLRLGSQVEIRGANHLVLLPPSRHPVTGDFYRWRRGFTPWTMELPEAPGWLVDMMVPPPPVERAPIDMSQVSERYVRAAIEGELQTLARTQKGGRNHQLYASARSLFRLVQKVDASTIEGLLREQALAIGLDEHEAVATIRSAARAREVRL